MKQKAIHYLEDNNLIGQSHFAMQSFKIDLSLFKRYFTVRYDETIDWNQFVYIIT